MKKWRWQKIRRNDDKEIKKFYKKRKYTTQNVKNKQIKKYKKELRQKKMNWKKVRRGIDCEIQNNTFN